jgi:hypothetical protein
MLAILGFSVIARADVTVQRKIALSGLMGMSTEGQDNQYIKGDKSYHDISSKFTSGIMKTMTGGKSNSQQQIIRVDKQLIWQLNQEKKTYTEMDFATFKQSIEQAPSMVAGSEEKPNDSSDIVWSIEVKPSDKNETINGFNCNYISGKATGISKKDPGDTVIIDMQYWLCKNVAGERELLEFQDNYARAMGLDELQMQQGMQTMFKNYGDQFKKMADEMGKIKGYPIKTAVDITSSKVKSGYSEKDSSGSEDQQQSISDIMGKLGGKLGDNMIGKDDKKEKSDNPNKTFSMTSEVISISIGAIDAGKFEIPVGFKKQETR